jgi:hypothetical protein
MRGPEGFRHGAAQLVLVGQTNQKTFQQNAARSFYISDNFISSSIIATLLAFDFLALEITLALVRRWRMWFLF